MSGGVGFGSGFGADGPGFSVALGGETDVKGFGAGVHAVGFTAVGGAPALAFDGGSLDGKGDSPKLELAEGNEGSAEVSGGVAPLSFVVDRVFCRYTPPPAASATTAARPSTKGHFGLRGMRGLSSRSVSAPDG